MHYNTFVTQVASHEISKNLHLVKISCFMVLLQALIIDDVDIYMHLILILCNSLNYNLIYTKLGTMVYLLILYQLPELCGTYSISVALIVNM